jgi:hypothetical protein
VTISTIAASRMTYSATEPRETFASVRDAGVRMRRIRMAAAAAVDNTEAQRRSRW